MHNNLDEGLLDLLGSEKAVREWWDTENSNFDGDTPEQVFRDNPNRVTTYIQTYCYA